MSDTSSSETTPVRGDRKFSVSSNRGQACHKVRYVEAGGAAVDTEECVFCESVPILSDTPADSKKKKEQEQ